MQMPPQHWSDCALDAFTSSALASLSAARDERTIAFTNKQAIGLKGSARCGPTILVFFETWDEGIHAVQHTEACGMHTTTQRRVACTPPHRSVWHAHHRELQQNHKKNIISRFNSIYFS
jgi:hypothetical protein